ncbi:DUF4230 domain-containing protein [candidate division WOR-3 bacterium]|nr:DUF4230 domain-containing protein [candidate division WOR-3 bacterium]
MKIRFVTRIKLTILVILIVATGILLFLKRDYVRGLLHRKVEKKALITILRSEDLSFLVTNRLVTQLVVQKKESNPFLGTKEGYLIAKVKLYYGVDLNKLTEDSIEVTKNNIIIHMPASEVLDFAVDLPSVRFITKKSVLMKIADKVKGNPDLRKELEEMLYNETVFFFKNEKLLPSRTEIEERLQSFADLLSKKFGRKIIIKLPERKTIRGN